MPCRAQFQYTVLEFICRIELSYKPLYKQSSSYSFIPVLLYRGERYNMYMYQSQIYYPTGIFAVQKSYSYTLQKQTS